MRSVVNLKLATALLSGAALLFTASCRIPFPEPARPKAGDRVPPEHASGASSSRGTAKPSLYEYSDDSRYITTGKRIRFHVDNAYVEPRSRSDGPKSEIGLWYDADTLNHIAAPGNHVYATIQNDARAGNLTPENVILADKIFFGLEPSELRLRGSVCGLDAYDVAQSDYATRSIARYGRGVAGAEFWRQWGGSMLFGLKNERGAYSDVIACYQRFPTCTATTSYRGWPVRLTFPNRRICDYTQVVADARRMFDRFYLDETERSPGQTERRWRPITIRKAPR